MAEADHPLGTVDALIDVIFAPATERDLSRLLNTIVSSARRLTNAEGGRVYALDLTNRFLHLTVAQDDGGDVTGERETVALYSGGQQNLPNPSAYAAFTGRLVNIEDIYSYTGFDFQAQYALDRRRGRQTRSLVVTPLRSPEGITIGVLHLTNVRDPETGAQRALPRNLERLVRAFASQAAVALTNVRLMDENRRLIQLLDRANDDLEQENIRLRHQIAEVRRFGSVIGDSPKMRDVLALVEKAIDTRVTVLVLGETGTGKEVIAQAIHRNSLRRDKAFVVQNCAAMPEQLLESELFGHKRGAFTGAVADKQGLIPAADGGTLFLDESGDMPLGLQAKLLRVLQDGEVRPVGATKSARVDVRVIAATNVDLKDKIARGEFREDLFYRLSVFPVELPPLRERPSDIPPLIEHFLNEATLAFDKTVHGVTPEAQRLLGAYGYPGNVRELKNIIERAVLLADAGGRIEIEHLPPGIGRSDGERPMAVGPVPTDAEDLKTILAQYEAAVIAAKLREAAGNQTRAARLLGISRRSLVEKLARYDIDRSRGLTRLGADDASEAAEE